MGDRVVVTTDVGLVREGMTGTVTKKGGARMSTRVRFDHDEKIYFFYRPDIYLKLSTLPAGVNPACPHVQGER